MKFAAVEGLQICHPLVGTSLSALADDKYGYQKPDWYDKDKLNLFRRCP